VPETEPRRRVVSLDWQLVIHFHRVSEVLDRSILRGKTRSVKGEISLVFLNRDLELLEMPDSIAAIHRVWRCGAVKDKARDPPGL
jgi:hypothetical protein